MISGIGTAFEQVSFLVEVPKNQQKYAQTIHVSTENKLPSCSRFSRVIGKPRSYFQLEALEAVNI